MDQKRLYKARGHRMVCGVCGGIAEYFDSDVYNGTRRLAQI